MARSRIRSKSRKSQHRRLIGGSDMRSKMNPKISEGVG